ncbi:MAG: hypothetical protein HY897_25600 [Deltaproteobacteria bacterium]|nr:hypothetical protein [Deltaproteobacteria bacterium]
MRTSDVVVASICLIVFAVCLAGGGCGCGGDKTNGTGDTDFAGDGNTADSGISDVVYADAGPDDTADAGHLDAGGDTGSIGAGGDGGADAGAVVHVLGFTGAGFLPMHNQAKLREFLDSMGYVGEDEFYSDAVGHMQALSGGMARQEFFYVGGGVFAGQDALYAKMDAEGFEKYGTVNPIREAEGLDPAFEDSLTTLVEGHPEISAWQIGNEPDLLWQDFTLYPAFFIRAQPVIRTACPSCTILLAGISNQWSASAESHVRYDGFLGEIAKAALSGRPFDVFDFHYYKETPSANEIVAAVTGYRSLLVEHGLGEGVVFWCTETGTYSGDPAAAEFGSRTENDQARDLVRTVVWMAAEGVLRVFYWTVIEGWGNMGPEGFFDQMGLVYNGLGEEPALGIAAGAQKKAYTTYGLLAKSLQGTVAAGRVSSGVYRFDREQGPVYVVWDEDSSGMVTVGGIPGETVAVKDLVPDDQGKAAEYTVEVTGATVSLSVGELPQLVSPDSR